MMEKPSAGLFFREERVDPHYQVADVPLMVSKDRKQEGSLRAGPIQSNAGVLVECR
jgi:hypothetical protein